MCGPASIVPPIALTVIVSTWFVLTAFVAVAGVIWMFALTNVFTASAEFGATPSVATVKGAEPMTETVELACPVTVPAVFDVKTIVHWPAAFVFAPASSQVRSAPCDAGAARAVSVKSTCWPGKATKPPPSPVSCCSVTVNVCGWPTTLVAFGVIWILALTQRLVAGPEFPPRPFVVRVSEMPPTETVVERVHRVDAR